MKLCFLPFLLLIFTHGHCNSDIRIGYRVTLAVPVDYSPGFTGTAFIMEADQKGAPKFRVALTVESAETNYTCSLDVFLGNIRVWTSGHLSHFYTVEKCVLELTLDGDLRLKGQKDRVGWLTGTSGQGVQRLILLPTGNLALIDALSQIKWQSFNFPTNIMLRGQRLNVATHLTSFPNDSSSFFSFEIQHDKLALYLKSGKLKYSYWEFQPPQNQHITFIEVGNYGLDIYGDKYTKITQIPSHSPEPLQFLALGNETGNLGLYNYSPKNGKFEASYQALNKTCDFPLACRPYGICTLTEVCSCIRFIARDGMNSGCSNGTFPGILCGKHHVEMIELQGVTTVLKEDMPAKTNVKKKECVESCLDDCNCLSALFLSEKNGSSYGECYLYALVRGVKQVGWGSELRYMVKVPKGTGGHEGKSSGLEKWVLVVVGVADGLILVVVLGGIGFYVIRKRRRNLQDAENNG